LEFKKWLKDNKVLKEVGTSTSCIAGFQRKLFPGPIRRKFLGPWAEEDPFFKKKKKDNKKR